jgi:putative oxidoreductase
MNGTKSRLPLALLALRLGIFLVLIIWTLGKFVNPTQAISIYSGYYGMHMSLAGMYALGAVELVVVFAFLVGFQKRISRAVVMAMIGTTVLLPGRLYFHPYMDHILLFFAFWPMLAGCYALYSLSEFDTLWSLPSPSSSNAASANRDERIARSLLLLRISLAIAFGMWCAGKFLNPNQTSRILNGFYSIKGVSFASAYGMGILEAIVILAFLLGFAKRVSYALLLLIHIPGVLAPWAQYLHPYQGHVLLFLGAFPMLSACFTMYYLRDYDVLWVLSPGRAHTGGPFGSKTVEAASGSH